MCNDTAVVKMPSAPRLNFGGHATTLPVEAAGTAALTSPSLASNEADASRSLRAIKTELAHTGPSPDQQAAFLNAVRHVLANTEDVGDRFANQARAMHYGDAEPRSIRGQATRREASELMEEGIDVMAIPLPAALKETLQ